MPANKYELKISFPSPIIDFDEWYGEKNAEVKGTPPRKYKAKSKTLIVKILEDVLSGKGISGIAVIRVSGPETNKVIKVLTKGRLPKPRLATHKKILRTSCLYFSTS